MSSIHSHIHHGGYVPPTTDATPGATPPPVKNWEDGASSIEASKTVLIAFTPLSNSPILPSPNDNSNGLSQFVISTNKGDVAVSFLLAESLAMNEISSEVAKKWNDSLAIMAERVREMINSPMYQVLLEIHLHGDPQQVQANSVGGVSTTGVPAGIVAPGAVAAGAPSDSVTKGVASSGVVAPGSVTPNVGVGEVDPGGSQQGTLIAYIDRLKNSGKVSPSEKASESQGAADAAKAIIIPFTATIIAGGAIAMGAFEVSTSANGVSSSPLKAVGEITNQLQPIYPQIIQDVLPTINLMVMPLVYYTSWDSSVANINNKSASNDLATAQTFAEKVIKMAKDPNLLTSQADADKLTPEQKAKSNQEAAATKLVLASVALSLLYSVEVGKTNDGKFWGMEPQEFQGMLTGTIPIPDPLKPGLSKSDELKFKLLEQIKAQLKGLPADKTTETLTALFSYLSDPHDIKDMLSASKVMSEVFTRSNFTPEPKDGLPA